ncbi:Cytochrome c oxidase assembly protein COX19 domain protein [Candida albicans]|uniref:Cytochrome c oxidase assembly protein COX19 n=3 Tax=Candida albicans TaxID=5476 RepID=COX19_CANAL|nr:Cox19p [Candida albicans SC5314]Q5AL10.2 RecName: Full=Cytochrome c oxidase assembly protein COX19 [Candida albicans SC5314]KAF6069289.1 Cytochrome c oxidase assembly protein COX19 domain protein [Candida albicans]KGQ97488.1 cytochrome c oxidase assembly protein COX19 [Candida albicans P37005]KGR16620.1 cytochrome c oxidase assembly protein COX19 [Candida albicans P78048]KGU16897.1 cytochrome c oxidase assembly protein COX19 [Candida albicans 19F]KHC66881.1 cytochrome c oxidase assembly pr|eukprot:XP_019330723.1 Cox19p [Candida albicans SC5314]
MATGAPGGNFRTWTPTPPERGSFPLDHDGECKEYMTKYLTCMKFTENKNAPNCRILAKQYLKCRMDNQLMEKSDWDSLGLVNLPGENDVELDHHHHLNNNNTKADGKSGSSNSNQNLANTTNNNTGTSSGTK